MFAPSDEIRVGDLVNVPGGMYGTVKYLGIVDGKPGRFAGIELAAEHSSRGKNNGEVDGRSYFITSVPGAGIFVPMNNSKYVTRRTPVTPPTPSRSAAATPNFSKSLGPPSMPKPRLRRPSLPRPESPRVAPSPPKPVMTGLRTPSTTLKNSMNGPLTNGSARAAFPKTPSRPSDRPPSRVSAGDETPTSMRIGDMNPLDPRRPESRDLKEKIRALEMELKDRDKQLEEQTKALSELQESVAQLEIGDLNAMRAQLREKNEKIAQLTADFDVHRADFRSTLDTLEVAASETERVYEKRLDELMQQNRELQDRGEDVETVARQLKQLEELVSELEEGLEDARRGEAEARGEVEFLRGEVERAHLELKQEREKSVAALKDAETRRNTRELDQKDDEIRGLKAIIHSLSRGEPNPAVHPNSMSPNKHHDQQSADRIKLDQRIQDLETELNNRSQRIEDLQKELLRSQRNSSHGHTRSGTVTVAPLRHHKSNGSAGRVDSTNAISHVHTLSDRTIVPQNWQETDDADPSDGAIEDVSADIDNQSSDDTASLWCEICETKGHDILTCTTFGSSTLEKRDFPSHTTSHITNGHAPNAFNDLTTPSTQPISNSPQVFGSNPSHPQRTGRDAVLEGLKGLGSLASSMAPVAGKASGVIDETKWCALCERDGHESIDCPFED